MRPLVQSTATDSISSASTSSTNEININSNNISSTNQTCNIARATILNFSPSDNYVYSKLIVNDSTTSTPPPTTSTSSSQRIWLSQLSEPTQTKRCIVDSIPTKITSSIASTASAITNGDDSLECRDRIKTFSQNKFQTNAEQLKAINSNIDANKCESVNDRGKLENCDNYIGVVNEKNGAIIDDSSKRTLSVDRNGYQIISDDCMSEAKLSMANKSSKFYSNLSNGNQIQRDQCNGESQQHQSQQHQCESSETLSLLIKNDPTKSITLLKPNTGSFIFTKKETNPTVHRKNGSNHRSNSRPMATTTGTATTTSTASTETETWSPKRHSFHWQSERNDKPLTDDCKRKQVKSWYSVNDKQTKDDEIYMNFTNNLSTTNDTNASHESASLIDASQSQWRNGKPITPTIHSITNENATKESLANSTVSKYNRFEQLLKNLVGRKVSRETSSSTAAPTSVISSAVTNTLNAIDSTPTSKKSFESETNAPLLFQSAELSRPPSMSNLTRNGNLLTADASSSSSLNSVVQRKLWSVVPLIRREGSCASLYQNGTKSLNSSSLKKCETVHALTHSQTTSNFEPLKAQNRLRASQSIATCSRCSSILSLAANGSRYSLNLANGGFIPIKSGSRDDETSLLGNNKSPVITCKLCLSEASDDGITKIHQCGCTFCTDCMKTYVEFEIQEGAYDISCPDALCASQGVLSIINDISRLVSPEMLDKHKRFRLNREIELDKNRTWCPRAGCETVCLVDPNADKSGQVDAIISTEPVPVKCPTCTEEFCSSCKKTWHASITCEEHSRRLAANGMDDSIGISFDSDLIKCCPMCGVPIEKDEGCAQMMCKRCKHVFCWYCLASLDDDFLLRHYDKGPCKNKLGHSRASVVWHRAQVIGIFAGFGLLLLVASPLLLLAAPCIVCCKCRICSKIEDAEADFEERQRN